MVREMAFSPGVAIIVDSAASLPGDIAQHPGLFVVPMRVTIGDRSYEDGRDLTPSQFYRLIGKSAVLPSTSAPSPAAFSASLRSASKTVRSILCLTVSSRFSATFDSAINAARDVEGSDPGLKISVLDTGSAAGGEGLIAMEAWRAASAGKDLGQVQDAAQALIPKVRLLAFLDTLYYLWKGGRVPRIAHLGTSLLKIKPIFELAQGDVRTVARPRSTRRAMARLMELMRKRVQSATVHAAILHADAEEAAQELRSNIEAEFPCDEIFIGEFTPVMGAHIGPGMLGIAYWCE